MKNTERFLLLSLSVVVACLICIRGAYATGGWTIKPNQDQNQSQNQHQGQHQGQNQNQSSHSSAQATSVAASTSHSQGGSVGDVSAQGGKGGHGGTSVSTAEGGVSNSEGGSVSNSGNSSSSSAVNDSGNSSVDGSGNSANSVTNTIIHRYPITLTAPSIMEAQQGDQIYGELQGVTMQLAGIDTLFIGESFTSDKAKAISLCGILGDASSHGMHRFTTRIRSSHSQYKSPLTVAKKLAKRAPKGTNQIVALVSTAYHSRGAGLFGGAGEMNDSGVTSQLTSNLSGAAVFPFPVVRVYYCQNFFDVSY